MQTLYKITATCILMLVFIFGSHMNAQASERRVPVPYETQKHFDLAIEYKEDMRYELARQHFLLALAACNTSELRNKIQKYLDILNLQIRTLR